MAVSYAVGVRNDRLDVITTRAGADAKLRIYSGARPAVGSGPSGVLLAELTCGSPFAPPATGGVLTANPITSDFALVSGEASWFRLVTSGGATVLDGDVGTANADLILNNTAFIEGGAVAVNSLQITGANA